MGKIKGFLLNRKQYEKIKRMDHCQMTLWAESIYKSGFKDGEESVKDLSESRLRDILLTVKGIGEKKADAILKALKEAVDE